MKDSHANPLKEKLSKVGVAIPGTIRQVSLRCGRQGCRCQSGKNEDKHGPYYFWDRKVKGKLTSSSIPKSKVPQLRRRIENRKKIEKLVERLMAQGQMVTLKELEF